ncbi:MAG: DUF1311 domain-containing protein [Burkholderiales bacterium]|nr:DUF1311 domain-containing protein [Burkholderiales bacterium]
MHYLTIAVVLLGMFGATPAARAEHESGKWNCAGTQTEMNYCAAASFKHVDGEMNELFRKQLGKLQDSGTKNRLREAQRAWLAFRDRSCLYSAGPREGSGSIWPLEHFGCMEHHTKQRIVDLKEYLGCTQNGCPN